jgi:transposase
VFGLGLATKIYVAIEAVDMRKGFEGLYGLVRDQLGADPLSGHLFLFSNRTRTRLKALVWDLCEASRYVELSLASASLSLF